MSTMSHVTINVDPHSARIVKLNCICKVISIRVLYKVVNKLTASGPIIDLTDILISEIYSDIEGETHSAVFECFDDLMDNDESNLDLPSEIHKDSSSMSDTFADEGGAVEPMAHQHSQPSPIKVQRPHNLSQMASVPQSQLNKQFYTIPLTPQENTQPINPNIEQGEISSLIPKATIFSRELQALVETIQDTDKNKHALQPSDQPPQTPQLSNFLKKHFLKNTNTTPKKFPTFKSPKQVACKTCLMVFNSKQELLNHKLIVHNVPFKTYECHICSRPFGNNSHLQRHINSVHSKVKQHKCLYCAKSFSRYDKLKAHSKRLHNVLVESIIFCDKCNTYFSSYPQFNKHMCNAGVKSSELYNKIEQLCSTKKEHDSNDQEETQRSDPGPSKQLQFEQDTLKVAENQQPMAPAHAQSTSLMTSLQQSHHITQDNPISFTQSFQKDNIDPEPATSSATPPIRDYAVFESARFNGPSEVPGVTEMSWVQTEEFPRQNESFTQFSSFT